MLHRNSCLTFSALLLLFSCNTPTAVDQFGPLHNPKAKKAAQVADGFYAVRYAEPHDISYPTGLAASGNGDVYVCVDKNGSIGRGKKMGSIVKCQDTDGDGKADKFVNFVPNIDSPRSSCFVGDTLYVVNPPYLTAYRDTTGNGVADVKDHLVTGMGFPLSFRGADHTSNGVRMGIDGYLYVAIGDYGMEKAVAKDGSTVHLRGGGVLRVKTDGSELEVHTFHTRNIYDVAVSPRLDIFARDNTNDGKGWNTRFHHLPALADMGYPRLYKNFSGEHLKSLFDYGGGSGTGMLFIDEPGIPADYNNRVYSCDWTTRKVYVHGLKDDGASFEIEQKLFYDLMPVDMDIDGSSRIYISDWVNGRFVYAGKNVKVGGVSMIVHKTQKPVVYPNLQKLSDANLAKQMASKSAVRRINAQHEILKRGPSTLFTTALISLAENTTANLNSRIAAIFTLKLSLKEKANPKLLKLVALPQVREFALRAMTSSKKELGNVTGDVYVTALKDKNPRVRLQAVTGLARLGNKSVVKHIFPLTASGDSDSIVPHVATKAIISLGADDACLKELSGKYKFEALRCLKEMHSKKVVSSLMKSFSQSKDEKLKFGIIEVLARLCHKDEKWEPKSAKDWWGTRPDDRGPYYKPVTWEESAKIKTFIEKHFSSFSNKNQTPLFYVLKSNRMQPLTMKLNASVNFDEALLDLPQPKKSDMAAILEIMQDAKRSPKVRVKAFDALTKIKDNQLLIEQIKILEVWGKRNKNEKLFQEKKEEFIYSMDRLNHLTAIEKSGGKPRGFIANTMMTMVFNMYYSPLVKDGSAHKKHLKRIIDKNKDETGFMTMVGELGLSEFEGDLKKLITEKHRYTRYAVKALKLIAEKKASVGKKIAELKVADVLKQVIVTKGDVKKGEALYKSQACMTCHAISKDQVQKGPFLGDGKKFPRSYLAQSILEPSAAVAQGFQSVSFILKKGNPVSGFVTDTKDGIIKVRNIAGIVTEIKEGNVKQRVAMKASMMPPGLANNLTVKELASLLDYLQSLKSAK